MSAPNLVVVSHYDQRPTEDLLALLDQISDIDAGAPLDVCVVVNATTAVPLRLPGRHEAVGLLHRPNLGFNVGGWQHAWRTWPEYDFYLFLQDECVVRRSGWLSAALTAAGRPGVGYVGESTFHYESWKRFESSYPAGAEECRRLAAIHGIPLGPSPEHVQTLVVGARGEVLRRTGGFVEADGKVSAIAGEVLTSLRARALGFRNVQIAWRPFEYIEHPQWSELRERSARWTWWVSRAMHLYAPRPINRLVPRRTAQRCPDTLEK
jgi:hypothetical protein